MAHRTKPAGGVSVDEAKAGPPAAAKVMPTSTCNLARREDAGIRRVDESGDMQIAFEQNTVTKHKPD